MYIVHVLCKFQTLFKPPLPCIHTYIHTYILHTADSERVQKCESSSAGENVDETSEGKKQRKNSHKAKPVPHPHEGTDYIQRNIEVHVHRA